jgi:hypothetical protein
VVAPALAEQVRFRKERRATRRALHQQPIEKEWMR